MPHNPVYQSSSTSGTGQQRRQNRQVIINVSEIYLVRNSTFIVPGLCSDLNQLLPRKVSVPTPNLRLVRKDPVLYPVWTCRRRRRTNLWMGPGHHRTS
jgi:hypothetical protein